MVGRRSGRRRPRRGFGLVEVIVALVVLSVAVLGVAATSTLAARLLRQARARERATVVAASVLDSLLLERSPSAGTRTVGRYRLRWSVDDLRRGSVLELTVSYRDGTEVRRLVFGARQLPPPRSLGGRP